MGCSIAASEVCGRVGVAEHVAIEATRFDAVDTVLRRPEAFLIGDLCVVIEAFDEVDFPVAIVKNDEGRDRVAMFC
jgi:hypothetical protein